MSVEMMDKLMLVSLEGPTMTDFSAEWPIDLWWTSTLKTESNDRDILDFVFTLVTHFSWLRAGLSLLTRCSSFNILYVPGVSPA